MLTIARGCKIGTAVKATSALAAHGTAVLGLVITPTLPPLRWCSRGLIDFDDFGDLPALRAADHVTNDHSPL
jgi:hypothetical protein